MTVEVSLEHSIGSMKALGFLNTRIGRRYLMIFLLISLLPLVVIGWFAISISETALRDQTRSVLRTAADGAEAQLREFLIHVEQRMLSIGREEQIRESLEALSSETATGSPPRTLPHLSKLLASQQETMPYAQEIFILARDGRVVASSESEHLGLPLSSAPYFHRGEHGFFAGDVLLDPTSGQPTWVMTAPIMDAAAQRLLGVVAFRIDPHTLSDLTTGRRVLAEGADTQGFRIGDTGETYIVNRDRLMITESRSLSNSVLKVKVDTLPVRVAFERGQETTAEYPNYRGKEVSGASMILRDVDWVVLTEIDFSQAFAPIQRLRHRLGELTAGLALLVVFLAWTSTRRIIRPIHLLNQCDRALARNDESGAIVPETRLPNDEIGELVRTRNARVQALLANQRQLQERTAKLRDLLTELEHMSYSMIHEMRAPLRALIGFGEMVVNQDAQHLSLQSQEYFAQMKAAASRMDHLICDLLNYSLIVRAELPLRPLDVSQLLRGIVQTYPALQPLKANIQVPPNLPPVQANEAALVQCFSNLLDNAVKFVQPGLVPEIQIRGEKNDQWVRIWVEDNGIGIPASLHNRIFGVFERQTLSQAGTGIGLAIVRKTVERMGGRVGLISQPGQGSRFWVELHSGDWKTP